MIKKQLYEQSLQELRKLENIFEENSRVLSNFKGDIKNGPKNHAARPLGNWQSDNAWDLFAPSETQWYSITKGKVTKVYNTGKSTGKVYGTQVSVEGMDGYPNIFYTHLKNVTVERGDIVDIGTPIGEISEWGQSKSTHVHVGLPYGKHIQDLLTSDYSQTLEKSETSDYEIKDKKDPDKLEKFIDDIGIANLADIEPGDKMSQEKLLSMIDDIDIIDTEDGLKIFGYSLDDILEKIASLLPVFESKKKKKNLLEDIERIKSKMIK
jgi:murein DD-endopeptidase MepM/ murein hydrolase activator NlpD